MKTGRWMQRQAGIKGEVEERRGRGREEGGRGGKVGG